jgi:hypothetical protein
MRRSRFATRPKPARWIADDRLTDDQRFAFFPEQGKLAGRLPRHAHNLQRANAVSNFDRIVDFGSLAARVIFLG